MSGTQDINDCGNNSIATLAQTVDPGLKQIILRNKHHGDTSFVMDVISSLNELSNIETDLFIQAGGFNPDTGVLLHSCKTVKDSVLENIKTRINLLKEKLELLKDTYPDTREQNILDIFLEVLERDILPQSFSSRQYSEILFHILVQHNKLYTQVLDYYLFPE